jgi:putative endopeptidase
MKSKIFGMVVACELVLVGMGWAQSAGPGDAAPKEPPVLKLFDMSAIDKTVDPCVNFYEYACGNWRKDNPIPSDQTNWGRFNQLAERNRWLTYQVLAKAAAPSPQRTPLAQKYGDMFASCMNDSRVNELGAKPIEPLLAQVAALKDTSAIATLVAELQEKKSTPALFRFGSGQDEKDSSEQIAQLRQGGLGLPDRDYYLESDPRSTKIRSQYVEHLQAMFKLLGDTPEQATAEANSVMEFETALAKASQTRTAMREPENTYHRMSVSELEKLAPDFDWKRYFAAVGTPALTNNVNVGSPDFFKQVSAAVKGTDVTVWKSYLRWQIVHAAAPWLSDSFADENFNFFGKVLSGQKEQQARWKRCTTLTDSLLGEALGQDWVNAYFGGDAKANMQKLVVSLETALGEDVQQLDWMSPATKAQAEKKLAAVRNKIGYPDKWRDYSSVMIARDDLHGNIDRARAFEFRRQLNKIGKPVDETEWGMTPPTVNAYYNDSYNDINFPAGILQPPFYDNNANIAENLGGIGVVIGHEITHGFDDNGSKYDEKGNLREWYTPADRKAFTERTDCEVAEYGNFEPAPGQKLNGKLTLGENTADNGGVRIAYLALMDTLAKNPSAAGDVSGYNAQQQFFISYGQLWCENSTEEVKRLRAKTDPHSPGEFRVNGVVQNFDAFGKAFGCKVGQPMMPVKSCRVW